MIDLAPHPWLDVAWANLGVAAASTSATDARIHGYFADAGHPEVTRDDVAWCAAFVGACLERSGVTSTRSLLARSYCDYGQSVPDARCGSIAVFSRGSDPTLGHVAFVVGETSDGLIVLGGNQGHAVSIIMMPRSRLLALRWPLAASPSAQGPPDDAAFARALAHVLKMEGGYTDDPYDPGGPTNLGLTMTDIAVARGIAETRENSAQLQAAVQALTPADAGPIYRTLYWTPCQAPQLPPALALFHFDTAVNHGLSTAARMLQQALSVDIDGEIGAITLAAATSGDAAITLSAYADIRRARYRALPTFWRFGRGWLARVDATQTAAQALIGDHSLPANSVIPTPSATPAQPKDPSMTTDTPSPSPKPAASATPNAASTAKWWGQSVTIWGTIVTTLSTVLPIVGPVIGLNISADVVHQLGDGVVQTVQALGGVVGILMTIYGRSRAVQPLMRRDVMLKL